MSFEALYEKYQNGTATPEEVAYVEEEIAKARKMSEILENFQTPVLEEASVEVVKKAKKSFNLKTALRTLAIVLVVLVVSAGAVLGGVFGTAITAASDSQTISKEYAGEIAKWEVVNRDGIVFSGEPIIYNIERELKIVDGNFKQSYYKYNVEIRTQNGYEIEIEIDGRNGQVLKFDLD